ncbi:MULTISPECIES: winged helix-turn-helix transcriptional regulator [Levilactobacillus]|uniref:MarR family transcriptional regulator n=2 Tax=Levilactobacillus TaxID=2767886 RepID=A0A1Y6JTZ5_9LACO|nr:MULTISPECIES: helix-turn-helix domain-containing protein [Levilactobacillus]KRK96671.1 transcriptional regulator [Levilactobacillus acidifarinae DSM 19394]KRL08700.1 transcriptional regulator [Levilactobacillus zymae DSM 19395]QFR61538.1 MarR family transcriptional regulator [Levilactobacillus zymae]SMS13408.1 Transcriptional regulator, HxlR family [Levilactobacillus zymae]GEO70367.1 MarR family transcriptional regulator [Levilactobacillus acidifarinae]
MPEKTYHIGVEATIDVIGGKWKPVILCHLRHQTMRTGELSRAIPQISQKMLTQQLRELEHDGIITRQVFKQVPPKVEYALSPYGETLVQILHELCLWGEDNVERRQANGEDVQILDRENVPN